MTAAAEVEQARLDSRLERYLAFDRVNRPYLEWQLAAFRPFIGRRVLEVGCGVGGVLDLLWPRERLFGIDVDPDVLECARRRFATRPEFGFARLDVGRLDPAQLETLRAERFDTLVSFNVFEHVEDDALALRALAGALVPGATLALLVPAHPWLYGPYDALDGHFRRYTRRSLDALLRAAGFRPRFVRHFNAVGAAGWFVQYKLLRRSIHSEGHFGLMNRLVPVLSRVERLVPPPFGLSLVALAHAPQA
jgi:SAM-dependent methyltransferase